jgi:hypothetical protein
VRGSFISGFTKENGVRLTGKKSEIIIEIKKEKDLKS